MDAARAYEKYSYFYPGDIENLYLISQSFLDSGDSESALNYGERLGLREPRNLKNLELLFNIYFYMKNQRQVIGIIKRISEIDPNYPELAIYSKRAKDLATL